MPTLLTRIFEWPQRLFAPLWRFRESTGLRQLVLFSNAPWARAIRWGYFELARPVLRRGALLHGVSIQVALTYRCQCTCVHCSAGRFSRLPNQEMTFDETASLIRDARRLGAREICFFGGEPLLVPFVCDLVAMAHGLGFQTRLDTNGWLLDEAMLQRLKAAGLNHIDVSLDGADAEVHDRLRGMPGLFDRAVQGIRHCREAGMFCTISTYATRENLRDGQLEQVIALAQDLGVETRILSSIRSGRWEDREDIVLTPEDTARLKSLLDPHKHVYWETVLAGTPDSAFVCPTLQRLMIYVSAYGDVLPCSFLPMSFGNVRKEPFSDIVRRMWGSEPMQKPGHSGCLMNDPDFRRKYQHAIGFNDASPKTFEDVAKSK